MMRVYFYLKQLLIPQNDVYIFLNLWPLDNLFRFRYQHD